MNLVKANPLIGEIESGVGNWFTQFWRKVPFAGLMLLVAGGVGIPPENLTRIFNHGFTTREDGHGFGLHSRALAAKEMGGSLTVQSDRPGKGANFTLHLPVQPESTTQVLEK
jgi:K+-sensing histidine kinase KdpD